MTRIRTPYAFFALMLVSSWAMLPAFSNDGAASVAVGGIQLKREARISMEKERLTISREKVAVEYEFLNATDEGLSLYQKLGFAPVAQKKETVHPMPFAERSASVMRP